MKVTSIKGFKDVFPPAGTRRERMTTRACRVLESYGYGRIELPLLEKGELFVRAVGASSDIVEKEMYAFTDKDKDATLVALRPEGTASVVRAFIEAGGAREIPVARLFYTGPMFRRERPQKGRLRQFHQIGAEYLGRDDPAADAETLCLVDDICRATGIHGARILVNSLGDRECRPAYRESLTNFARSRIESLCADCRARLERNPLRILDCKNPGCAEATADAPLMADHLCDPCERHYGRVIELAEASGVKLQRTPRMVRGLDYYVRTAFEVVADHKDLGSQNAIGGGGRYDGLVAQLGGADTPGIGFALGVERMELAGGAEAEAVYADSILIAPVGESCEVAAALLARRLRLAGAAVEVESGARKLKAQMKRADKAGAGFVVLIGPEELAAGRPVVRDMIRKADYPGCFGLDDDAEAVLEAIRKVGNN